MQSLQLLMDKTAVALSVTCAAHCLLFPVALVLLPSIATLSLGGEAFHQGLLFVVLPASLVALTMGCRRHKRYRVYFAGVVGLTVLGMAAHLGHDSLGGWGEKLATLAGAVIIGLSHLRNYQLCRQLHCQHGGR